MPWNRRAIGCRASRILVCIDVCEVNALTHHYDATDHDQAHGNPLRCSSPATGSVCPLPTHVTPPCDRSLELTGIV